jgi:D-tagatose-1,6-bisphosphate aldolase subunit GatZ/KbaZ
MTGEKIMQKARDYFLKTIIENRKGKGSGIYSVCSAHRMVLKASMLQAKEDGSILLIESTSNQVDQFGGYTGMKPQDFVLYVKGIAHKCSFIQDMLMLGGDHLGPNNWQKENAVTAMEKAKDLIRAYVSAGFEKIHLDASMFCADDLGDRRNPLDDRIVAERAGELCRIAEEEWKKNGKPGSPPLYIIGTEVPVPGGAKELEKSVRATECKAVRQTISVTKDAFYRKGLEDAWSRVVGVVVQPGVEFGNEGIFDYSRKNTCDLKDFIEKYPGMVYEAHSTDYQTRKNLKELVEDHFCILKVGPWLTFAYREAVFALSDIESEYLKNKGVKLSGLKETMEKVMLKNTDYWKKYYTGNEEEQKIARKYSLSDRSRYYWFNPDLTASVERLMVNLSQNPIPLPLVSQYMPEQYYAFRDGRIDLKPESLVVDKIREVLRIYSAACGMKRSWKSKKIA